MEAEKPDPLKSFLAFLLILERAAILLLRPLAPSNFLMSSEVGLLMPAV
jgi:hypothetical protein